MKQGEPGNQILYFPKPVVFKVAFTYWWLISKVEHGSDDGSLEMAEGPEVFEGLLTNPQSGEGSTGMFIIFADDI